MFSAVSGAAHDEQSQSGGVDVLGPFSVSMSLGRSAGNASKNVKKSTCTCACICVNISICSRMMIWDSAIDQHDIIPAGTDIRASDHDDSCIVVLRD